MKRVRRAAKACATRWCGGPPTDRGGRRESPSGRPVTPFLGRGVLVFCRGRKAVSRRERSESMSSRGHFGIRQVRSILASLREDRMASMAFRARMAREGRSRQTSLFGCLPWSDRELARGSVPPTHCASRASAVGRQGEVPTLLIRPGGGTLRLWQ